MSGGIDSAVSALIMQQKGYDVTVSKCRVPSSDSFVNTLITHIQGVFMKNWDSVEEGLMSKLKPTRKAQCSYTVDREDLHQVVKRLDIPLVEVDFVKDYWLDVFTPFIEDYQSSQRTPNPDVQCNRKLKFSKFSQYVSQRLGLDTIAFGHYARLDRSTQQQQQNGEIPKLLRAKDENKCQTYFLSMTPVSCYTTLYV